MAQLTARESLLAVSRIGAGSGAIDASSSRALLLAWDRAAENPRTRTPPIKLTTPEALRAAGINFVGIPRKRKQVKG